MKIGIVGSDVVPKNGQQVEWEIEETTMSHLCELSTSLAVDYGRIVIGSCSANMIATLFKAMKCGELRAPVVTDGGEVLYLPRPKVQ